MSEVNDKIYEI
jgi:ubiquitin-activating enzyme E1